MNVEPCRLSDKIPTGNVKDNTQVNEMGLSCRLSECKDLISTKPDDTDDFVVKKVFLYFLNINPLVIQSPCQMMIGVYNHLLRKAFSEGDWIPRDLYYIILHRHLAAIGLHQ